LRLRVWRFGFECYQRRVEAPILVTGATGRQGGAVAKHLLDRKQVVRALTRNPTSSAAKALAARGAEVCQGDLEDQASLERALRGARGVFSVQDPWLHGVAREIGQGKRLADAAKSAGVGLVVHGSVGTADEKSGIPHFESKGIIEAHMRALGLRVVSVRSAFFMDSLVTHWERRARLIRGAVRRGLRGGKVQLTAVDDIGRTAADAFGDTDKADLRIIELAGDELSFDEIVDTFVRVTTHKPRVLDVPFTLMRLFNHEAFLNFRWLGEVGWHFDLEKARADRPWLSRFEPWLQTQHGLGFTRGP
jgi:uncharacterized protein YbjT (DUF2867 family)